MVCDMTPDEGYAYLNAAGLQLGPGGGSLTYVTDETGQFPYRIPLSCINPPLKYKEENE